jgi:hypothetical protein
MPNLSNESSLIMSTTTGPSQTYIDNHILYLQTTYIGIIQTDADNAIIVYKNFELNFLGEPSRMLSWVEISPIFFNSFRLARRTYGQ